MRIGICLRCRFDEINHYLTLLNKCLFLCLHLEISSDILFNDNFGSDLENKQLFCEIHIISIFTVKHVCLHAPIQIKFNI